MVFFFFFFLVKSEVNKIRVSWWCQRDEELGLGTFAVGHGKLMRRYASADGRFYLPPSGNVTSFGYDYHQSVIMCGLSN